MDPEEHEASNIYIEIKICLDFSRFDFHLCKRTQTFIESVWMHRVHRLELNRQARGHLGTK